MNLEQQFAAEIAQQYARSGWKISSPDEVAEQLHFKPDLYLTKDGKNLVIQVRREGFVSSLANDVIKRAVELDESFIFETKILPRNWKIEAVEPSSGDIGIRMQIAEKLKREGHQNEAFILFWTVIEASLRHLMGHGMDMRPSSSSTLLRDAYEEGIVVDGELRQLQAALQLRDHLVHGLQLDGASMQSIDISDLAKSVVGRTYGAGAPSP